MRLRLQVPERLSSKLRPGQRIDVRVEGSVNRTGTIVRISPAIEAQNRSLLVEAEIPNPDNVLRSGSFAEGVITVNPQAQGIAAPLRAVVNFAGVERVFIVRDHAVAERIVKVGRHLPNDMVEIVSGLNVGDVVIAEPSDKLPPGQLVEVTGG
jgi:membrane fusion protein (multidrug efflux system)